MKGSNICFAFAMAMSAAVAGCGDQTNATASSTAQLSQARDKLVADEKSCSGQFGFDPNNTASIPDNALAPQELQWNQCIYSALRAYERSNPSMTGRYEQLISEHSLMTASIQQGTMTRTQRRSRMDELLAQVEAGEDEQAKESGMNEQLQTQQVRRIVNGLRGLPQ